MYVTMSVYSLTKIMHLCRFYRFVQYLFFETNYCSYFIRLNESLKIKQGKSKLVVTSTYSHLNWQIFPVFNVRGFSLWGIHSWVSYNFLCSYCSDIRKGFFENKGKIRLILQLLYFKLMKYISCDKTAEKYQIIMYCLIESQRIIACIWKWLTLGKSSLRCGWTIYYFRLWRRKRIKKETHVDCYFFLIEKIQTYAQFSATNNHVKTGNEL